MKKPRATTIIGRWRELMHRTKSACVEASKTSFPTWMAFELERRDYLARARTLFYAVGAAILVVPPNAGTPDVEVLSVLGRGRWGQLLTLVNEIMTDGRSETMRGALAAGLFSLALQVGAPSAASTREQVAALSHHLHSSRYTVGFEPKGDQSCEATA